jgi:hypothetical protein
VHLKNFTFGHVICKWAWFHGLRNPNAGDGPALDVIPILSAVEGHTTNVVTGNVNLFLNDKSFRYLSTYFVKTLNLSNQHSERTIHRTKAK